jgi:hypothetical protein
MSNKNNAKITCQKCLGKAEIEIPCVNCEGFTGFEECEDCDGKGVEWVECDVCEGFGYTERKETNQGEIK